MSITRFAISFNGKLAVKLTLSGRPTRLYSAWNSGIIHDKTHRNVSGGCIHIGISFARAILNFWLSTSWMSLLKGEFYSFFQLDKITTQVMFKSKFFYSVYDRKFVKLCSPMIFFLGGEGVLFGKPKFLHGMSLNSTIYYSRIQDSLRYLELRRPAEPNMNYRGLIFAESLSTNNEATSDDRQCSYEYILFQLNLDDRHVF